MSGTASAATRKMVEAMSPFASVTCPSSGTPSGTKGGGLVACPHCTANANMGTMKAVTTKAGKFKAHGLATPA